MKREKNNPKEQKNHFFNTKVQRHRDFIPLFQYSLDHKSSDRGAVKLMYNYMEITCLNIFNTNDHELNINFK